MFLISEDERSEPEQRVAAAMVRLLVTAGNSHSDSMSGTAGNFDPIFHVRSSKPLASLSVGTWLEDMTIIDYLTDAYFTKTSVCSLECCD